MNDKQIIQLDKKSVESLIQFLEIFKGIVDALILGYSLQYNINDLMKLKDSISIIIYKFENPKSQ